jgi:membrane-bound serine protease (ClpP class)
MAPSTSIGAAHPVDSSGGDIQGDLRLKAENDAVDHIVNIAKARGRNEQWAEDAVRKSVSARVDDALAMKVVDLQANDVADLLAQIDGRAVTTAAGAVTLVTKNVPVIDDGLNPIEAFLHLIVDPQIAVLLFTLGTYGLIFELSNPGLIFPGIVGVIAIILALFSFGTLDANGAAPAADCQRRFAPARGGGRREDRRRAARDRACGRGGLDRGERRGRCPEGWGGASETC